jgi:hypothetical protein
MLKKLVELPKKIKQSRTWSARIDL